MFILVVIMFINVTNYMKLLQIIQSSNFLILKKNRISKHIKLLRKFKFLKKSNLRNI